MLIDQYGYMRLNAKKKYGYISNMFILPFWQCRVKKLQKLEEELLFRFMKFGGSIEQCTFWVAENAAISESPYVDQQSRMQIGVSLVNCCNFTVLTV